MKHALSRKRFLFHKVQHRYMKLNQTPAQIAEDLKIDGDIVNRICDNAFFHKMHSDQIY